MNADDKCILLAERIAKILLEGIHLNSAVMHYIDSTFSNPSIDELKEIIADNSDCENDSLIELIFFPDESIQMQLEDILQSHDYSKKDEKKILDYLCFRQIEAAIHFPDNKGKLTLAVPQSVAGQFLTRLNISKKLDKRLLAAIDEHVSEKSKTLVKVRLRNSTCELSRNEVLFLCDFLKKTDSSGYNFFECLDFMLSFLDEAKNAVDIFAALMDKKRFYFKNVQLAEKFNNQLDKANMETMILQGLRTPYINIENEKRKMEIIDKIGLSVFGRTEYFEKAHLSIDLGEYRLNKDMEKAFQMLFTK